MVCGDLYFISRRIILFWLVRHAQRARGCQANGYSTSIGVVGYYELLGRQQCHANFARGVREIYFGKPAMLVRDPARGRMACQSRGRAGKCGSCGYFRGGGGPH